MCCENFSNLFYNNNHIYFAAIEIIISQCFQHGNVDEVCRMYYSKQSVSQESLTKHSCRFYIIGYREWHGMVNQ